MEIKKLFGHKSTEQEQVQSAKNRNASRNNANAENAGVAPGDDVVNISSLSRSLSRVSSLIAEDEQARAARVEEIKKAVADGTYNVSSTEVAKSLVSFAGDLEPLR